MQSFNVTLQKPSENLALDEVLIETAEVTEHQQELFRLWEPTENFVVIGRSSSYASEVNHEYCSQHGIPVFRRVTGGASIVAGPGCLMYAVLLDYRKRPELRMLDQAHQFVMQKMANAIESIGIEVSINGICDLTIDDRKVSGNSLRCKRNWMLYHGTLIYDFDCALIGKCLDWPKRTPDYRKERSHDDFVGSIPATRQELELALKSEWELKDWEQELATPVDLYQKAREMAEEKYDSAEWNRKVP